MFVVSMAQLIWGYIVYLSCENTGSPGNYMPAADNPFDFFCTTADDIVFWVPTFITVYVNCIGVFTACGLKYKAERMEPGKQSGGKNFYA